MTARTLVDPAEPALTVAQADASLRGEAVVPCMTGSLGYIKEVRDHCLRAGIAVAVAAPAPGRG